MKVSLTISVDIETDRLRTEMQEYGQTETVGQGFPISDENTAWMIVQMIADDASDVMGGISCEVIP